MDRLKKGLNTLLIFLFLVGIVVVAYVLFELPEKLIQSVDAINNNNIDQASTALNPVYLVVGFVLLVGMGIITLNLMSRKSEILIGDAELELEVEEEDEEEETSDEQLADESKEMVKAIKEISKGKEDKKTKYDQILAHVCKGIEASQGVIYLKGKKSSKTIFELYSSFAFSIAESESLVYELGEGLIGQAGKEGNALVIDSVPEGHMEIFSGLGNATPTHLYVIPLKKNNSVFGVAELSSFKHFNSIDQQIIQDALNVLGTVTDSSAPKKASQPKEKPAKRTSKKKEE